ncbi:MAG TPA: D-aminoacyl-tRNA deacylase [Dehalococcoidia bacterium]|nr:D-aminoacyl-tRNA deacylase [Dehalococcoidia bacterium]
MRAVLQRVTRASVSVDGETVGAIGAGLLLLVGIAAEDDEATVRRVARKCCELRIFSDDAGRFNRSLLDAGGEALAISQFTLQADVRKGRRPGFTHAAPPDIAAPLIEAFVDELRGAGVRVASGRFGAKMLVELVNDGPVTVIVDSEDLGQARGA